MPIHSASIYVAPNHFHMKVLPGNKISLVDGVPFEGIKPSGNALFESVAKVYGPRAIAAILSGMGHDGTIGLKKIKEAGGRIIAQDEKTSVIFGMPKSAIEAGVVDHIFPIEQIGPHLVQMLQERVTK